MPDMLETLNSYASQLRDALELGKGVEVNSNINRIIIAGMGGSAWPGDILAAILREEKIKIPIEIVRDYFLPAYVDEKTLVFVVSYSGNTEETILMYSSALKKNAQTVVITSGGKLRWLIKEADKQVSLIRIPSGYEPRLATGFILVSMLNVLRGILPVNPLMNINKTVEALAKTNAYSQKALEVAERLFGKIPLIYTSNRFFPAAYVWKISINETAKMHAFCNSFSEINHNELSGFIQPNGSYHVLIIKDEMDYGQVKKRMNLTKAIIREHGVDVTELLVKGDSFMTKMLTVIYLGLFTAYHLALKNNVNPSSVDLQENLKKML